MQSFVGREHELATLGAALDAALSGQGQAVVLVGEPGIGKTCTVQAFSAAAAERGIAVLWGRCHHAPGPRLTGHGCRFCAGSHNAWMTPSCALL
jgi:hypothetical protein